MQPVDLTQLWVVIAVTVTGLFAGVLGGMLGVGGAIIVIPGLTWILGHNQHAYQATAMITSVAVSLPAAVKHYREGAVVLRVLRWMAPFAMVFVMIGVVISNSPWFAGPEGGIWLGRLLCVFLIYEIGLNGYRLWKPDVWESMDESPYITRGRVAAVGSTTGLFGGLLGVGGGVIAVPLQQVLLRLPLRSCIANASAVICTSSTVGAVWKNSTLSEHGLDWRYSVCLAMMLAPSCWLGGHLGASLTHRLPIRHVRAVFIVLMSLAAYKMAAIR
jgi:uncharacterized membrane protein YfcA